MRIRGRISGVADKIVKILASKKRVMYTYIERKRQHRRAAAQPSILTTKY